MKLDMQNHSNSATEKYEKVVGLGSTEQNWEELKRVQTTTRNQLKEETKEMKTAEEEKAIGGV